jgi:hypothetical protein
MLASRVFQMGGGVVYFFQVLSDNMIWCQINFRPNHILYFLWDKALMLTRAWLSVKMVGVVITYHIVLAIDVGPMLDELLDHLQVSLGCRPLQGSAPRLQWIQWNSWALTHFIRNNELIWPTRVNVVTMISFHLLIGYVRSAFGNDRS